jgi:hypothetical protein
VSDGATNLGAIEAIGEVAGNLHAVGLSSQVYRRADDGTWINIGSDKLRPEPGIKYIYLRSFGGMRLDSIYVCGAAEPQRRKKLTDSEYREIGEAAGRGDTERVMEIYDFAAEPVLKNRGRIYYWDGKSWSRPACPDSSMLTCIFVEAPDKIWVVGYGGAILRGNAVDGFEKLNFHEDTTANYSFTKFNGDYVVVAGYDLFRFTGHNLSRFRPAVSPDKVYAFRVQAVDDVLYCFTYGPGVYRFDGTRWDEIPIPPELLERDFKGLQP